MNTIETMETPTARAIRLLGGNLANTPPPAPAPTPSAPQSSAPSAAPATEGPGDVPPIVDQPEMGDLLVLPNGMVVVYRQFVPDKNCHFVYQLVHDGQLMAKAVILDGLTVRKLGRLEQHLLRAMIRDKQWEPDRMVDHLDQMGFERFLALDRLERAAQGGLPTAAGTNGGNGSGITRGTRIVINYGAHQWEAVYWSPGPDGDVVAFLTGDQWRLTTMDLKQYADKMEKGAVVSAEQIQEILTAINSL